jgi:hypothetical protein
MYERLQGKQKEAIQNAKKLHAFQCNKTIQNQNPVTTVFELIERLQS